MADQLPDALSAATRRARAKGLDNPIVKRLATRLTERAKECKRLLTAAA
jgi:hypothetical protein